MTNDIGLHFLCLSNVFCIVFGKITSELLPSFKLYYIYIYFTFELYFLYILETNLSSDTVSSYSVACLFTSLIVSFEAHFFTN